MYHTATDETAASAVTKTNVHKSDEETVPSAAGSSKPGFSLLMFAKFLA
jgi:hypothetical protein